MTCSVACWSYPGVLSCGRAGRTWNATNAGDLPAAVPAPCPCPRFYVPKNKLILFNIVDKKSREREHIAGLIFFVASTEVLLPVC